MEPLAWVSVVFVLVIGGGLSAIIWWSLQRGRRVAVPLSVPAELPSDSVVESTPERSLDQSLVEHKSPSCVLDGINLAPATYQLFQIAEPMSSFRALFVLQERGYREASRAELVTYLECSAKHCPAGRIFALRLLSATLAVTERERAAGAESDEEDFAYRLSQVSPASAFVTLEAGDYVLGVRKEER